MKKTFVIMFIEELEDGFGEYSFKTPKATYSVQAESEEEAIEKAKDDFADILFNADPYFEEYQDARDFMDWLDVRISEVKPGCNYLF